MTQVDETFKAVDNINLADEPAPPPPSYLKLPDSFKQTLIGKYAARVAHCIEFPEASTAAAMLVGASVPASMAYAVEYATGTPIQLGLYAVIEQPPSMAKSRLLSYATLAYHRAVSDHNRRIFTENKKRKDNKGDVYLGPTFTSATDATSAGMDKHMAELSEGRFNISTAEQIGFESLFPEKGNHSSNTELLLKGWQGEFVSGMRQGRNAFYGIAFGSVLVIAQPGSSSRVLSASNGTGLAERFLYVAEPSPLGTRSLHGEFVSHEQQAAFNKAVAGCVKQYSDAYFDSEQSQEPEALKRLRLTPAGYQKMLEVRRAVEPKLLELFEQGRTIQTGWLGKIETHVLKVAAVIHVFESIGNGSNPPDVIPDSVLSTALEFVEMIGDHMGLVLEDNGIAGDQAEEQAVIDTLMGTSKPHTIRTLCQALRRRNPFRAMGRGAYQSAKSRVMAMMHSSQLMLTKDGKIETL